MDSKHDWPDLTCTEPFTLLLGVVIITHPFLPRAIAGSFIPGVPGCSASDCWCSTYTKTASGSVHRGNWVVMAGQRGSDKSSTWVFHFFFFFWRSSYSLYLWFGQKLQILSFLSPPWVIFLNIELYTLLHHPLCLVECGREFSTK